MNGTWVGKCENCGELYLHNLLNEQYVCQKCDGWVFPGKYIPEDMTIALETLRKYDLPINAVLAAFSEKLTDEKPKAEVGHKEGEGNDTQQGPVHEGAGTPAHDTERLASADVARDRGGDQ